MYAPPPALRSLTVAPRPSGLLSPGVSVVIPVKDDAPALDRCLEALSRQTQPAAEVIIVDNGSSDDLREVTERWGAQVLHEPEPGIPAASTTGYDAARYSVIARLDADSVPPPDWIASGLRALEGAPLAAAVTGPGDFYDGPKYGSRMLAALYLGAYFSSIRLAVGETPLFGSSFFLRAEAWRAVRSSVHRWGTTLHDDLDLTIHLTPEHAIVYDPSVRVGISFRPFAKWKTFGLRLHRGFVTLAVHWPGDSALLRMRRRILDRLPGENTDDDRLPSPMA
ncbi:glycosyltransferase family 2 protein [Subtercola boreus]|uniref:glycosyltransferase family 2 protein n=1 Tax=Subtercola boreus TaxID=120213 RepID=UPI001559D677|nr:glycosyltransferase family 2 protein [Subtercola boreus]